jgi:DNA polymerase III epsilon subunit-like protein
MRPALVFFDLETTGLSYKDDEVIQIAAVAVDAATLSELGTFEAKLVPSPEAKARLWEGSHYDEQVWNREGLVQKLGWNRFFTWLKRYATCERISKAGRPYKVAQLAGYNAASFDKEWLWVAAKKHDLFVPVAGNVWDILQLAITAQLLGYLRDGQGKEPADLKLGTLAEWLHSDLVGAHDALVDVRGTVEVAKQLMRILGLERLG